MVFSLVIWSLVVFGMTHGLSSGGLFTPMWNWLCTRDSWLMNKVGELFSCPKCLGFWVAGLVSMFIEGPMSSTWIVDIQNGAMDNTVVILGDMFVGSAVCSVLVAWCRRNTKQ